MRILVACEYSATVRDALIERGHDAWSCDMLPTEKPGPHLQCDVRKVLDQDWDMMIAFPPCTYLCSSGLHWNKRRPERAALTEEALEFVRTLLDAPIHRIALENPIGLHLNENQKAGPGYSAVAIWTSRKQEHLSVAQAPVAIEANEGSTTAGFWAMGKPNSKRPE